MTDPSTAPPETPEPREEDLPDKPPVEDMPPPDGGEPPPEDGEDPRDEFMDEVDAEKDPTVDDKETE